MLHEVKLSYYLLYQYHWSNWFSGWRCRYSDNVIFALVWCVMQGSGDPRDDCMLSSVPEQFSARSDII